MLPHFRICGFRSWGRLYINTYWLPLKHHGLHQVIRFQWSDFISIFWYWEVRRCKESFKGFSLTVFSCCNECKIQNKIQYDTVTVKLWNGKQTRGTCSGMANSNTPSRKAHSVKKPYCRINNSKRNYDVTVLSSSRSKWVVRGPRKGTPLGSIKKIDQEHMWTS